LLIFGGFIILLLGGGWAAAATLPSSVAKDRFEAAQRSAMASADLSEVDSASHLSTRPRTASSSESLAWSMNCAFDPAVLTTWVASGSILAML
jgi:hypothetical protein